MKKQKQLLLALAIGALVFFGNKTYLDARVSELSPKKYVGVVRAKTRLRSGSRLSMGMLEQAKVPENFVPKASVRWNDRDSLVGEELNVDVLKGDYILNSYFAVGGSVGRTLSQQLSGENFRAITIPVDDVNSLARSIVSGDRIDISITFTMPVLNQKVSTTLLQNVLVLSTGQYSQVAQELGQRGGRNGRYNSLTLKLGVEDAMRLNYARQIGKIGILLRSPTDDALAQVSPIGSVADLLSAADKQAIADIASRLRVRGDGEANERMRKQIATLLEMQRRQGSTKK